MYTVSPPAGLSNMLLVARSSLSATAVQINVNRYSHGRVVKKVNIERVGMVVYTAFMLIEHDDTRNIIHLTVNMSGWSSISLINV